MRPSTKEVAELSRAIGRVLHGRDLPIAAMAPADQFSLLLLQIDEGHREAAIKQFIESVKRLMPINEKMLAEAERGRH